MARRSTRATAIILGRTKLREQDLILTMISEDGSQVRAIAKGARKPGSRLAARTELFCESDLLISHGRGLSIVTEAEVRKRHTEISSDIEHVAAASTLCEITRLTTYENVTDPFQFQILSKALDIIGASASGYNEAIVVAAFAIKVLSHCGWRPEVDTCIACGEPSVSRFSVAGGGILCESCAKDVAGAVPITASQVEWIKSLINSRFEVLASCTIDEDTSTFLLRLAHSWCATHLEARLRAFEFYAGM